MKVKLKFWKHWEWTEDGEERLKWSMIADRLDLAKPGEVLTLEEVKKRFKEKLYPNKENA